MLDAIKKVVALSDTDSGMARLKLQAQEFSRAYAEFQLLRKIAETNPIVNAQWQKLNKMSFLVKNTISDVNYKLDVFNNASHIVFGSDILSNMSDFVNAYILSSIATLKFATNSLVKFNRSIILPKYDDKN